MENRNDTLASIAGNLIGDAGPCDHLLALQFGQCRIRLRSNSEKLVARMREYFGHVLAEEVEPDFEVIAIERNVLALGLPFMDWAREPGKCGRKDAYYDIPGGRVVLKVRTGMVFLQSEQQRIVAGPCLQYDNQVINFINAQYMNWLQHRGWLICHASGLVKEGRCVGIAGFSGGGKSTLMLHLLEYEGVSYLTNDRLFLRRRSGTTEACGIPKLPRINPGTIVHNPRLHGLIPESEREALLRLPPHELWEIEDKYDVPVEEVFGAGKIIPQAGLQALLVLNWQRDSDQALAVNQVELAERSDLLAAIMKSPGPFYQYKDGTFHQDTMLFDESAYLSALQGVVVYEALGGVDFEGLAINCIETILR